MRKVHDTMRKKRKETCSRDFALSQNISLLTGEAESKARNRFAVSIGEYRILLNSVIDGKRRTKTTFFPSLSLVSKTFGNEGKLAS